VRLIFVKQDETPPKRGYQLSYGSGVVGVSFVVSIMYGLMIYALGSIAHASSKQTPMAKKILRDTSGISM